MNYSNQINHKNHSSDIDFESIWQYGTAENGTNPHLAWQRDGVAPQCAIPGLDWNQSPYGRVRFQGKADFIQAHLGENYGWVLGLPDLGRVIKRD
jgi:hypothetical protein